MAEEGYRWTKNKVIQELKRLREELGRSPVVRDNRALAMAARRLFGSWNEAKEAADLGTHPPAGESPLERKLLKLLDEKGVVTRSEAVERLGCKRNSISNIIRRSDDISGVRLSTGRSSGDIKYRSSKLFKPDVPYQLIYGDVVELGKYMKGLFRFELSPGIERGKKIAITRFLQDRVPRETLDYLHSLYTKD